MKTRRGSASPKARRRWFNLELAKKPPECLEHLVVHEPAHLLVGRRAQSLKAHMDRDLPRWRMTRKMLNTAPLANDTWEY